MRVLATLLLLTCQWMSRHGIRSFGAFNTPWAATYPGLLRAHGYYVGHVGKWHNGAFPYRQFDLRADTQEETDRAADPNYQAKLEEMRARFNQLKYEAR